MIGVRVLTEAGNFSLHHHVQTGFGPSGSFPGGRATGAWSWALTFI